jgi:hypothetical protein
MCCVRGHELPIDSQLCDYEMGQWWPSRSEPQARPARPEPRAGAEVPGAWGAACAVCPERSRWLQGHLTCLTCPVQSRDPLGCTSLN